MPSEDSKFVEKYGPWAIVTGASSGIGAQFCRSLAKRGLNVILIARRVDRLEALAAEISSAHSIQTHVIQADLTKPDAAVQIGAALTDYDVGLLVNNAGVEMVGAYLSESMEKIQNLIALNVTAVATLSRVIGPRLAKRKRGGMIFVSSVVSRSRPYIALYAASKSFVSTLAVSLRYELSEYGVEVISFEPGFVESEIIGRWADCFSEPEKVMLPAMDTKKAVESCLSAFGLRDVHIPQWVDWAFRVVDDYFPTWFLRSFIAQNMRKALRPEKLKLEL